MADYRTVFGFVQFDVNEREANGQTVRDVVVQFGNKNVRLTVWPENKNVILSKGSLVFAQGKYTESNVNGKTYYNLSVNDIMAFQPSDKVEAEVENPVEDSEDEDSPF